MRMHRGRTAHSRGLQHRRPEQRVEIQDVLADEVMQFGARVDTEEIVELQAGAGAQLREARQISDRRIEPDVEIFARRVRNLEAEVGRVARDVPVPQALRKPFIELAHDAFLHRAAAHPGVQAPARMRSA